MSDIKAKSPEFREVQIDIFGETACFSKPDHGERVTFLTPTPSGLRGVMESIYLKPNEFYYQITGIDVMRAPRTIDVLQSEVHDKMTAEQVNKPLNIMDIKTRKHTIYLRDVYYRVYAKICKRDDCSYPGVTMEGIYQQFMRRVSKGQYFRPPYLGLKECMAFFSLPNENEKPIAMSKDLGIMVYDPFDFHNITPIVTGKNPQMDAYKPSFFHAYMINGHINVPEYDSPEVFKEVKA